VSRPHGAHVAVDVALLGVRDGALHVLLVRPARGPFAGWWALPGGRVRGGESLDEAAARELRARTGLGGIHLEQLYTFGGPDRDPTDRVVSVAYVALVAEPDGVHAPSPPKYADAAWWRTARSPRLAYDHDEVLRAAVARVRAKLQYTNLAYALVPSAFTLRELQAVYEAILGRRLDRRNFRKRLQASGLLAALGRVRRGAHRPAAL
jgi:ADP-ribose pyrophosphatase YjhB (NUDIX family)